MISLEFNVFTFSNIISTRLAPASYAFFTSSNTAMYLSFIIMENQEQLRRFELPDILITYFFKIPDWIKLFILCLSLFVIIMLAVFVFMRTIKEEIDKKIPNKLEEAKTKLSNEIKQVSDLQKSICDDNVVEDLNSLKQKMENQLCSLKKFDIEK